VELGPKFKRAVLASTDPTKLPEDRPPRPALTADDLEAGQKINIERDKVWITVLHQTKDETWAYKITDHRDAYMGKSTGLTLIPSKALSTRVDGRYEPPVVPLEFQAKLTRDSRRQARHATAELIAAAEDCMSAIDERLPGGEARLARHRIRRELERFIERQRRRAA
jgi:hypothetical protein